MRRIDLATLRRDEPPLTVSHMLEVRRHRNAGEIDVTTVHLEATRIYFVNILSTNAAA